MATYRGTVRGGAIELDEPIPFSEGQRITVQVDLPAEELSARVEAALREEFPRDTIDLEPGYGGRVRAKIVSRRFNGMSEREKQAFVWDLLRARLGTESQGVTYVLAYGTDEL
ncbi:MAG: hypothetical protein ACK47B_13570 [Armatimonadota bacterium]